MSLATLTSKDLSRVQRLIERKEALTEQVAEINAQLQAIESGAPAPSAQAEPSSAAAEATPNAHRPKRRGRRTARGQLKERVSNELKSAGKQGMKIGELAERLGTGYGNITAFFQTTAKKIKAIKKIGPARFAWVGA